jgi:hypothetical protein
MDEGMVGKPMMAAFGVQPVKPGHRALEHPGLHMVVPIGTCSIPMGMASTFTQEANVVTDDEQVLTAKRIRYYSENDESAFFEWLDKIGCVTRYEGQLDVLYIYVDGGKMDEYALRELLSLFRRYGVDMKQLVAFDSDEYAAWFRDPQKYWHRAVFGDVVD